LILGILRPLRPDFPAGLNFVCQQS
jgi:hypothetical protein